MTAVHCEFLRQICLIVAHQTRYLSFWSDRARKTLNWFVQNADIYNAGGTIISNMTSKRPNSPNFAVLVIALSSAAVIVAGHTAYGITGFVALGFAYLVAISTPLLSRCAPLEPVSKL